METPGSELPRGTVTFLFTDIEGSTELVRRLGADFGRVRSEHRRLLREAFAQYGGHEIDTAGDGFFVVFERAGDAVAAAVAAQRALQHSQQQEDTALRVRMGLHSAEPYLDEDGYSGVGVNRAAPICAAGRGGQILVSNATAGIIEDLGIAGVELQDLGEYALKDLNRPQRLFQLVVEGLTSDFPALQSMDRDRARPRILTLLITDVRGWRRVLRELGDEKAAAVARSYQRLVAHAVEAEGGRALEVVGDSVVAAFELPRDAIRAAVAARSALQTEPWSPSEDAPGVAMAIHSGRIADPEGKHLGTVALHCSVLADQAEPWQILVSHATEALLAGESPDVSLVDLGERALAGSERPVRVFAVSD